LLASQLKTAEVSFFGGEDERSMLN
jgi:hypothetical protein